MGVIGEGPNAVGTAVVLEDDIAVVSPFKLSEVLV